LPASKRRRLEPRQPPGSAVPGSLASTSSLASIPAHFGDRLTIGGSDPAAPGGRPGTADLPADLTSQLHDSNTWRNSQPQPPDLTTLLDRADNLITGVGAPIPDQWLGPARTLIAWHLRPGGGGAITGLQLTRILIEQTPSAPAPQLRDGAP
jgi:hypothetical protein